MRSKAFRLAGALALATLAASCSGFSLEKLNPLSDMGFDEDAVEVRAVADRIAPFTSRVEVYREFNTVFTARALELTPEVRRTVADYESKSRLLDPAERRALETGLLAPAADRMEFLLGFYAPGGKRSPLEGPDSEWSVFLSRSDGSRVKADCRAIDSAAAGPFLRFLRWDLAWSVLYRVSFPLPPSDPSVAGKVKTILITGPGGKGEMAFPAVTPEDGP